MSVLVPTRPALRYHGGKWNLAPFVIAHLPPHDSYVEPFAGGCSVLLNKPRAPIETVNDLNADVINFFSVLRTQADELVRLIDLTPWARAEYEGSFEPTDDPLERARRFFVRCWMAIGDNGGHRPKRSGWRYIKTANARWTGPAQSWCRLDHLHTVAERFKGAQIECRDAFEIMPRLDGSKTLFYVDPPYLSSTRATNHNAAYTHELTDADHVRLAEALKSLGGMVVLSGYPSALYNELYAGWTTVRIETQVNGGRGGSRTEVLWLSPRTAAALDGGLFGGLS